MPSEVTCLQCERRARGLDPDPFAFCSVHPFARGTFSNVAAPPVTFADIRRAFIRINNLPKGKP